MMIVILILAILEFIFMPISVEGWHSSVTQRKIVIKLYANESASWNNASKLCQDEGGQLLTIDSLAKFDAMSYFYKGNEPEIINGGRSWIGLHTKQIEDYECKDSYFWHNCQPLSYAFDKHNAENTKTCETERCITFGRDLRWRIEACDSKKTFFCEFDSGNCDYNMLVQEEKYHITHSSILIHLNTNASSCRDYCDKTVVNNDWLCWFFSLGEYVDNSTVAIREWQKNGLPETDEKVRHCDLHYFRNVPLERMNSTDHTINGTKFYIKDCFQGQIVNDYKVNGIAIVNEAFPNVTCHLEGSCYFETTADPILGDFIDKSTTLDIEGSKDFCEATCLRKESCWFIDRFSHISNFCRLYYLNSQIKLINQHVGKNREDFRDTLFIKRCPREDDETTTEALTTTTTIPETDNTEDLRIDKKETSQYRNKFISVYEGTVSKVISGVVGTLFIALIVGFVVISDFPTIIQHAKTIGARNIRKRNICCKNKKPKKKTSAVEPTNKTVEDDKV